ncbi:MAG: site-specific recombinase XerD [Sphaerisporangium sp.]|nr:site-specific recombinase XerD [Sphaerisporangium sp.]
MTSEIARSRSSQGPGSASEITKGRPGARPTRLPPAYDAVLGEYAAVLGEYAAALERTPLSEETRRTYRSRVRMFLSWLADHAATYTADPLADRQARDWAVRDYRMWLLRDGPARRSRVYVNSVLTALDDFHVRRGLARPTSAAKTCPRARRARWRSAPASAGCAPWRRICRPGAGASR